MPTALLWTFSRTSESAFCPWAPCRDGELQVRLDVELVYFHKGVAISIVKCSVDLSQYTVGRLGCLVALPGRLEIALKKYF
jgi:hypothetical protein